MTSIEGVSEKALPTTTAANDRGPGEAAKFAQVGALTRDTNFYVFLWVGQYAHRTNTETNMNSW